MMHHVWINTPFLECSLLDRGLIDVTIQDLSSFLCTLIDNDYYILLTVNTFFVSPYSSFQEFPLPHEILIYGYKDTQFICSDYFDFKNRCVDVEIPFSEIVQGYTQMNRFRDYYKGILISKVSFDVYENQSYFHTDLRQIAIKMQDFLNDSFVQTHIPGFYHTKYGYRCGFGSFNAFKDYFDDGHSPQILVKPLHFFEQHILMMKFRFEFIQEEHGLELLIPLRSEIERVYQAIRKVKLRVLYYVTKHKALPFEVASSFNAITDAYYQLLVRFVSIL